MADATTLTPEEIQQLGDPIERIYATMTNELLINIGRHITKPTTTHTAAWEIQKLSEMGALTKENARIINKWVKDVPKVVRDTMEETRREALARIEREIEKQSAKDAKTPPVSGATTAGYRNFLHQYESDSMASAYYTPSGESYKRGDNLNLVHTTMLRSSVDKYAKAINMTVTKAQAIAQANATQEILNQKTANVVTGKDTMKMAMRDAIRQIANEGLAGFYDKAGRQWTPEAYVNMDIRTTVHNTAISACVEGMMERGLSIFQVSSHAAARPLCYPYQGKFLSWQNGDSGDVELGNGKVVHYDSIFNTTWGQPAGLFGINCGHYPIPIVPGVTIPHGADDIQIEEVNNANYKLSQKQRSLEREIRAAKRDIEMLGDTATDEDRQRLKHAQEKMTAFIADTGRSRRYDREAVYMAKPGEVEAFKFPDLSPEGLFPREHSDIFREFTSGEQATDAFAEQYDKWESKLTESQRDAIGMYTSDGYKPINQMLRGELTKAEVKDAGQDFTMGINAAVKSLDAGIAKYNLDQPIRVYRSVDENMRAQLDAALGGTFRDSAYMSTSVTPRDGDIIIQIDVPPGKGHGAWVDPLAQYGGDENEFLLARGTTLNIKNRYVNAAGQTVYEAEYVHSTPEAIIYRGTFVPAKTTQEAEQYATKFVQTNSSYTKIDYSKIDVKYANEMNRAMDSVLSAYDPKYKLMEIVPMNKREKKFKDSTADAAYQWGVEKLYYNAAYYKSDKTYDAHIKEYNSLLETVLPNVDKLLESKKNDTGYAAEVQKSYLRGLKTSGRTNVSKGDVYRTIVHEMGHYLDDTIFENAMKSRGFSLRDSYAMYAERISAYATESKHEYVAESFAAYWDGERDNLDPDLVKIFEETKK